MRRFLLLFGLIPLRRRWFSSSLRLRTVTAECFRVFNVFLALLHFHQNRDRLLSVEMIHVRY